MKLITIVYVWVLLAIPQLCLAQLSTDLDSLSSKTRSTRLAAFELSRANYARFVDGLISLAKTKNDLELGNGNSRELAVRLLGELGARKAIPVLIEDIEYFQPGSTSEDSLIAGYPCAEALRGIGATSVSPILVHLHSVPADRLSERSIRLFAGVLLEIYGPNEGGHRELIEVVRRAEVRTRSQGSLARLITELESTTRKWP